MDQRACLCRITVSSNYAIHVDACIANMVLMDIAELKRNLSAIYSILNKKRDILLYDNSPLFLAYLLEIL